MPRIINFPNYCGCMTFFSKDYHSWVIDDEETSIRILKKCYDSGLRTFDTNDVWNSNGKSEILLGKFIKRYNILRERIVILTKVYSPMDYTDPKFSLFTAEYPEINYVNSQGL